MPRERIVVVALLVAALARVVAAVSTWPLDWRAEDWLMLAEARRGAWPVEPAHVSVPRDALFWVCARLDVGPWLPRAAALAAHLVAALALAPRVAGRLGADPRVASLVVLALPATFEPLAWPCTCAYAVLEALLLALAWAHLAALDGAPRARAASIVTSGLGLATWEFGVVAPAVVLALSWARGRGARALARDVAPHAALVAVWVVAKLALTSTEVPAARGVVRVAGNVVFTPLLLGSPWPLDRHALASAPGALLALGALALFARLAWLGRDRVAVALGALPWVVLLPVLPGPGPESRYLLLAAPWAALLVARARPAGALATAAVVVWCACAATTSARAALRWREADREARAVAEAIVARARARGARQVVLVDAPDRLAGWGPTWKVSVWRYGLETRLARDGVAVVAQVHRAPVDPERMGLRRDRPALTDAEIEALARAHGALVVVCSGP